MMRFLYLFFVSFLVVLSSCTGERIVTNNYLYNVKDSSGKFTVKMPPAVIQKGDLLHIRVFSQTAKREVDEPYNLMEQSAVGSGGGVSPASGFLVNQDGEIEYPWVGKMKVTGLTKEQLADQIRSKLTEKLTNPSVIVRFLNYKVTVLGEVRSPGSFTSPTDNMTILDALGLAGDITEFGNRTNVKILREQDGEIEMGQVDLTSKEFFNSPYFRLQQNDKVLVEQTTRKVRQQEQQTVAQQIGIASSVITAVALILNLIR